MNIFSVILYQKDWFSKNCIILHNAYYFYMGPVSSLLKNVSVKYADSCHWLCSYIFE